MRPPFSDVERQIVLDMIEFIQEASRGPYPDSDLKSLVDTLTARARVIMERLESIQ